MKKDTKATAAEGECPEYLGAFLDGELSAEERARVLALLESDAEFKARACEMRTLKEMVRGAYGDVPVGPASAAGRGWSLLHQSLVAGLLLALGVGLGWVIRGGAEASPAQHPVAGLPDDYRPISLTSRVDPGRVILHVDSGEPGRLVQVLNLAERLLEKQPGARIEIVANSYGLDLLRAEVTPVRERIEAMAQRHANLSFVACGQSVARLAREGETVKLLPVVQTASSAIQAILTRMGQGWVYVKV